MVELTEQMRYCDEHSLPMFAPKSGICWSCSHQVKDNGKSLITGCDKCHRSFCE